MSLKYLPITLTVVLLASTLLIYILMFQLAQPMFTVTNSTDESLSVSISWRDNVKQLGELESGGKLEFNIADEAAMVIRASTDDGRELVSQDIYFTGGMTVLAEITVSGIAVKYGHRDE